MTVPPRTQYARAGQVHVAYQTFGTGPTTVVLLPQWTSHIEVLWESPQVAEFLERLGAFTRVVLFDKRGVGLSDPVRVDDLSSLDPWIDDLRAVLDAAGVDRATLLASGSAGPVALLFAATHPERVASLILANTYACRARKDDYPAGIPEELDDRYVDRRMARWGSGESLRIFAPSVADDLDTIEWYGRYERLAASPGVAEAMHRVIRSLDVRSILPSIQTPTLVAHAARARGIVVEHGRYLAEHLPDASYVELPSADGFLWFENADPVLSEVEEFLTGHRPTIAPSRVLAAVVFSDIVSSTELVASVGDLAWRRLLGRFHDAAARLTQRHGGRLVKSTGDGVLATFDAPGRAIAFAVALRTAGRSLDLRTTAGIHMGEIELVGDDVAGIAVHIASRVLAAAAPGQVLVSASVPPLVAGSGQAFRDLGPHTLKGIESPWNLHEVTDP